MRYMLPPTSIPGLDDATDDLFLKAIEEIIQYDRASASLIQRRLGIGYARAARLLDQLAAAGVVGPSEGSKAREVLIHTLEEAPIKKPENPYSEAEEYVEMIKSYQVPEKFKLSKVGKVPWEKQLKDVIESEDYKEADLELPISLGYDDKGKLHIESLPEIANLIVAGNALSKKEIFIDTLLTNYLLRYSPRDLRIILNDNSHYLDLYNGVPHLLSSVCEYEKSKSALRWSQAEMDRRFKMFAQAGVRDFDSYNEFSGIDALPRILIVTIILFLDVEHTDSLTHLTEQGARAGIHNILVASRTDGESLPRSIKSNVPARVVFKLTSAGETKAIDVSGAENLEPGQIIYRPNFGETAKLQAIFTPEVNVKEVVEAVKKPVVS